MSDQKIKPPKLIRITTVPISLKFLITGQMKYMSEHGFDVTMMSAEGPEIKEVVDREGCPHVIVPLTRQITPIADLRALWILYRKLKSIKPEIVHSHTPKAGLIGMLAAKMAGVPLRLHTVAGLPLEATTGMKRKILLAVEKFTYACCTEVWPNSNSLKNFISQHRLTSESKLRIIGNGSSNGIDTSEFNKDSLDNQILKEIKSTIKYDDQNTYLLFVGRMVRDKGVEELITMFKKLKAEHERLKLILVGPLEAHLDPLSRETLQFIESDEDVIATGFSNQVKYFMYLADLFIFPSHREGFPNVPMQAGLMDCPVVASRITGNVDIIKDPIDGLLHEKSNVGDLYKKVDDSLRNRKESQIRAKNLKEKIVSKFERSILHEKILLEYKRLLKH